MSTDDEKSKLSKLLQGLEVPDVRLTERCSVLIKDFHEKYDKEIEEEEQKFGIDVIEDLSKENPYIVPKELLEENTRKLNELMKQNRSKKKPSENVMTTAAVDPKRPWRTNSTKESLLRINNDLKHHADKATQLIVPLEDNVIKNLVQECEEENRSSPVVNADKLRDVVISTRKNLPNFQYKKVENTTATAILPLAHETKDAPRQESQDESLKEIQGLQIETSVNAD